MLLKFYKDFNTIGDLELLKDIPILCNIDAVQDTYLIAMPVEILRKKYFDNTKFLRHLVDSLSEKLYATINNNSYNFVYPLIAQEVVNILDNKFGNIKNNLEVIDVATPATFNRYTGNWKGSMQGWA